VSFIVSFLFPAYASTFLTRKKTRFFGGMDFPVWAAYFLGLRVTPLLENSSQNIMRYTCNNHTAPNNTRWHHIIAGARGEIGGRCLVIDPGDTGEEFNKV